MAIQPDFTAEVRYATQNILTLTDVSGGTDPAITKRRVTLQLANGSYLLLAGITSTNPNTSYFQWDYSVSFIDLNVLNQDYALNITSTWLNSSNVVLYTLAKEFCLQTYNPFGNLQVIKSLASNPSLINDQNWFLNKVKLTVAIDDANNAISLGSDIQSSQAAIGRGQAILNNSQFNF